MKIYKSDFWTDLLVAFLKKFTCLHTKIFFVPDCVKKIIQQKKKLLKNYRFELFQ